jgi:hypothetical protein
MKKKTFTDTALGFGPVVLIVTWAATLFWVGGGTPWVRAAHTLAFFIVISVVNAAIQVRADARLDEVELAAARFGARWGLVVGAAFMTVLTFLPPVHSLLAQIAAVFGGVEDRSMTRESRLFLFAILTTFMSQEIFRSVFTAAWHRSKR